MEIPVKKNFLFTSFILYSGFKLRFYGIHLFYRHHSFNWFTRGIFNTNWYQPVLLSHSTLMKNLASSTVFNTI